ncbi:hypothetical protein SAMN05444008_10279 [Cnuella takakiae]|uniref:DUF3108 domain-containing protein n=1 Tax=Cnuella takakiae TaxID=1302690 RepID=A0A1M4UXQ2_9BACT|nr:hypothetical protein [Cnuella takakiae]OLY92757.1 hypothetical protein BUE76_13305 [Cnuella takakiae]SHE61455.1 hypothetical protein SAMN05444008_10279 [Cnuella takakiae]
MKLRPAFYLFLLVLLASGSVQAQNLSGIWRGYFITEAYDQYKFEIQIKQTPKRTVSGVSYSYLTTVFYGKATLTGSYNPTSKQILLQEIKTVELRMSGSSVACIMRCLMEYSKSGKEEFLEGTYSSKYEKSDKEFGISRGAGCGGGKVFLRKVTTSDFYVEPFLRQGPAPRKPDVATTKPKTTPKPTVPKVAPKPQPKPPVASTPKKAVVPRKDSVRKTPAPPIARQDAPKVTIPAPRINLPATTRNRTNDLAETVRVSAPEIVVKIYDNGEIDDDTISVYLDNKLVLSQKKLTAAPLTINLKMDPDNPDHILVLVAENLGRIPPNTSLMIVQDGDKRHQVRITSTEQKNAMVRFRYEAEK